MAFYSFYCIKLAFLCCAYRRNQVAASLFLSNLATWLSCCGDFFSNALSFKRESYYKQITSLFTTLCVGFFAKRCTLLFKEKCSTNVTNTTHKWLLL